MNISFIKPNFNIFKPLPSKVGQQPKMLGGLVCDTFTKFSNTSTNPIKQNNNAPSFTGSGYWFNKTFCKLPYDKQCKICDEQDRITKMYQKGEEHVATVFCKNEYLPNEEYQIKAYLDDKATHTVYFDKDINKIGEEKETFYKKNGKNYRIIKAIDYRNNTTTKIRSEVPNGNGNPAVTDEVRILRDKNNNIIKKEMMTHSEVTGAYEHKYVYPDGTEKIISTASKFNENGKEIIKKDMTSLDGTRTQYNLEQDKNGNKKLEYKITDKKGNVLMNLNKSIEKLSENKFRTINGERVYDVTFEDDKFTIQEKDKEAVVLPILAKDRDGEGLKIDGNTSKMEDLLLKLPADQLIALHDTVKTLVEVNGEFDSTFNTRDKRINTKLGNDATFTLLHETGHAIDYRNSKSYKQLATINNDKDLQKIFNKEKKLFNKSYPNAQREHIGYFINGKDGNLAEVVAETNALRNSYTKDKSIAKRNQYLQQFFPSTIAYVNDKLENYNNS